MGYFNDTIHVHCRLESHNSDGDKRDLAAFNRLNREITALIDSDPEYSRIAGGNHRPFHVEVDTVQPGLINYRRNLIS